MSDKIISAANGETTQSFTYKPPAADTKHVPLIIDSPHSGRTYPTDFKYDCDLEQLRRLEDLYVDVLTTDLEQKGAHVLNAEFPRSYIDPSRPRDCLDPKQIKGGIEELPFEKTGLYKKFLKNETGLIFMRSVISDFKVYQDDNRPTETDIAKRLPLWDAYHEKLSGMFNDLGGKDKAPVYLLDMHSCWRHGAKKMMGLRARRPDVILSNNNGKTCSAEFLKITAKAFRNNGMEVQINNPFKGGYIVNKYGNPKDQQHSLQIEIARDLYIDEKSLELHSGVHDVQNVLKNVTQTVIRYIQDKHPELA